MTRRLEHVACPDEFCEAYLASFVQKFAEVQQGSATTARYTSSVLPTSRETFRKLAPIDGSAFWPAWIVSIPRNWPG